MFFQLQGNIPADGETALETAARVSDFHTRKFGEINGEGTLQIERVRHVLYVAKISRNIYRNSINLA